MKNLIYIMFNLIIISSLNAQSPECEIYNEYKKQKTVDITPPETNGGPGSSNTLGPNDERIVYWVHGLGGDEGSWAKAAVASQYKEYNKDGFEARMLQSTEMTYDESANVLAAASDVRDYINNVVDEQNPDVDKNNNFFIAHSQGGVVIDALLYSDFGSQPMPEDQRYYGGQVTFNSPHQGALLLNNTEKLIQMGARGAYILARPKVYELTEGVIVNWFINGDNFLDQFDDFVENRVIPFVFEDRMVETTHDYYVGAEPLEWFNNTPTPGINRVAFYSVEPTELLIWRTLSHFSTSVNTSDYWGANNDWEMLEDIIIPAQESYIEGYYEFYNKVEDAIGNPFCYSVGDHHPCKHFWRKVRTRDAYLVAAQWFTNVDLEYKVNMGAIQYVDPQYTCHCEGDIDPWDGYPMFSESYPVNSPEECDNEFGDCYTTATYTTEYHESDGVVLAESQMDIPFPTAPPVRLDGSSHMQIRNSTETKVGLTQLFDGHQGYFFKTKVRQ